MATTDRNDGMSLRQAALVAGFAYLLNPVSLAEQYLYPKLVSTGHIEQTAENTLVHGHLFVAVLMCYLICFIGDVVIAWALYVLLAPVNRSLSLLAAWFQLVYTAMGLTGWMNLVTAYRMLNQPEYTALFGRGPLEAQVHLLLHSFRYDWSMALVLFAIHLVLVGYLIWRSGYIPKWIGVLLVIDGVGWIVDCLQPYLFPDAHLGWVAVTFFGEIVFMIWLLIRGWTIREPVEMAATSGLGLG